MSSWRIIEGDCREVLRGLPEESVQCCITSPPYFGLRDYGHDGQLGMEAAPDEYVAALVETFREVRRVLRGDGTVWLNLGDTYNAYNGNAGPGSTIDGPGKPRNTQRPQLASGHGLQVKSLKPKDLLGIPWLVAFALRADGWYLRSEIIWAKRNCMPESVTDRPTRAHEQLFLLSKRPSYFYDADAIREPHLTADDGRNREGYEPRRLEADASIINGGARRTTRGASTWPDAGRNKRSVWTVATQPYPDAHFATFPPKLVEPCVLAGSRPDDTVLDPFAGAGTTGLVALRHDRSFIGVELNPDYCELARNRIRDDQPLLNTPAEQVA